MSVPTALLSKLVPFALSTDGSTYNNVVCKKTWDLTLDKPLIQEDSDCGVITGVGNSTKWSFNFEFILNLTPDSGQISADTVAGYANDGTLIYVKVVHASDYLRSGQGYITNYKESAPLNGFITSTGTFTGDGAIALA